MEVRVNVRVKARKEETAMYPLPERYMPEGRPTTNACLCFTLLSKMPTQKPWSRPPDERDPPEEYS